MTFKALQDIDPGSTLIHARYGLVELRRILYPLGQPSQFFGVVIRPKTIQGLLTLASDSGTIIPDFLEGSLRMLRP